MRDYAIKQLTRAKRYIGNGKIAAAKEAIARAMDELESEPEDEDDDLEGMDERHDD